MKMAAQNTTTTLSPHEKLLVTHALSGASIIDGLELHLGSAKEVDNFLLINELDLSYSENLERLKTVHNEAISYLRGLLPKAIAPQVSAPKDLRDLFLLASNQSTQNPNGSDLSPAEQACLVLKVMNTIHHIEGHELLYGCPISRRSLAQRVDDKIGRELSRLKRSGFPILFFEGGRKPKESLITKLLCKQVTVASRINDRLRYLIVTQEKKDVLSLLIELFSTVLPFNYLVPGSTVNHLIDPSLFQGSPELAPEESSEKNPSIARSVTHLFPHSRDEVNFSGETYHVLKFAIDVPVRLDTHTAARAESHTAQLGQIVFSLVEMTIVDEATHQSNQEGDNAHPRYKQRQKTGALQRMTGKKLS